MALKVVDRPNNLPTGPLKVVDRPNNVPTAPLKVVNKPANLPAKLPVVNAPANVPAQLPVTNRPADADVQISSGVPPIVAGINEAQRVGYAPDEILTEYINNRPDKADGINAALQYYSAKEILDEIVKGYGYKTLEEIQATPVEPEPQVEEPKSLKGFGKNILSSGAGLVKDSAMYFVNGLIHPVRTIESVGDPIVGLVGKVMPGASTEQQDAMANAVGKYFKERYGSTEALKKTAYEDPVGLATDISAFLSAGGSLVTKAGNISKVSQVTRAGQAIAKAGEITNPLNILKAAKPITSKLSPRLETSAAKQYSEALGATTKANKIKTDKVVPGLLEQNVTAFSKEGLQSKAQTALGKASEKLEDAFDNLPQGIRTDIKPIFDDLQNRKMKYTTNGVVVDDAAYNAYERMQRKLLEVADIDVSPQSLRELRQIWDKGSARTGNFSFTDADSVLNEARKAAANAVRNELANEFPHIAKINKEFSFWSNVDDILTDTIRRIKSQTGLIEPIAQIAGLATGSTVIHAVLKGIALKNIVKLFRSTGWRTISATKKYQLAKLLARGESNKAANLIKELLRDTAVANRGIGGVREISEQELNNQ